ncbi:MAG TPA: phenylalanine--tRNA ligase subunit beta [Actinomycetota bacterium]|nr:phenylalanine--tRNA ligase subunit beta [Actinomycetota bacterium]
MRVSLKWLKELVDVDVSAERLAHLLSMSGTKVEQILRPARGIEDVVVAEVLDISPHPNADNLTLVDVKVNGEGSQRVVCGARNFSIGDRVPLALVGARLPEMVITERKIRGEVSRGMLCSGAELGVSKDHSGILVLPQEAPLGEAVTSVLGLEDAILELEITPNRGDCAGMIGVAREVAALLNSELRIPEVVLESSEDLASDVSVVIEDAEACPRYYARYLDGLSVGPSPIWMQARLVAAGLRPISNIVDATNYVLLETGHPLHAFDASKIAEHKIVVRRARRGERFTTLDGTARDLHPDDLLIADPGKPVAIAGVMGGADSEVSGDTTTVILEAAYFDPGVTALSARRHLLRTEASARFERGTDPEVLPYAAARACSFMLESAGGRVAAEVADAYPVEIRRPTILLRPARTDALLGIETPPEKQVEYLRSIGLDANSNDEGIVVEVPSFRPDLTREVDLVEEVGRLAGYDRLPSTLPSGRLGGLDPAQRADRALRRSFAILGVHEAWTSSFMSGRDLDLLGLGPGHPNRRAIAVANPMSEEEAFLRTTLLPGLLKSAAHNFAHEGDGVALFEIARVYEPSGELMPREADILAALFAGLWVRKGWVEPEVRWDFFSAKGVLEAVFERLGVPAPTFAEARGLPFHPTRAATVALGDTTLGAFGELHPDVCNRFDVPEGAVAFELAIAPILAALPETAPASELPRFPAVYIDLAVIVDEGVAASKLLAAVRELGAPEVRSVRLFDLYRGDQIPEGKKSLAFALEIRDPDRTLKEQEALVVRDRIARGLERDLNAQLRA